MPPLPVKVAQVRRQPVAAKIEAVGDLLANESVVLKPEITGRIAALGFREGQKVKAGTVLIELNADEQRAALEQGEATLHLEREGFRRIQEIRAKNLVSQQQYDEALARLQNAQAQLAMDRVRLSRTRLAAPFDGILGLRRVSLGDYVGPGQALVNLESIDPVKLDFKVPEKYAGKLMSGMQLEARVDAWPTRSFSGEIQAIDPRLDEATRTVKVRARIANADLALRPGMFARIVLDLATPHDGLFVPEQAVETKGSQSSLYRVLNGKANLTMIKTGERRTGTVEIVSGLNNDDWVVTEGQLKLRDGMSVQPIH